MELMGHSQLRRAVFRRDSPSQQDSRSLSPLQSGSPQSNATHSHPLLGISVQHILVPPEKNVSPFPSRQRDWLREEQPTLIHKSLGGRALWVAWLKLPGRQRGWLHRENQKRAVKGLGSWLPKATTNMCLALVGLISTTQMSSDPDKWGREKEVCPCWKIMRVLQGGREQRRKVLGGLYLICIAPLPLFVQRY